MVGFHGAQHLRVHVNVEAARVGIVIVFEGFAGVGKEVSSLSDMVSAHRSPNSQGSEHDRQFAEETGTSTALNDPHSGSVSCS